MHIVILGNGIAGVTAARFIRKHSDHKITMVSGEAAYPYSRTALMYIYMGHLRLEDTQLYSPQFYKKNRIELVQAWVKSIDFNDKKLAFSPESEQAPISYDQLILATGSEPNRFGWPGERLKGVHGMYSLQDLQKMEDYSEGLQRAVIVGGGLIGIEMAEMFHSRQIPVSFLVREDSYWNMVLPPEESGMVNEEIFEHEIDLQLGTELKEILPDEHGKCRAVISSKGEEIECGFVGLTAGVHPNVDFLRDTGLEIEKGIVVDAYLKTNMEDVYAIGDCAQLANPPSGRRPIEAVWYIGKMMGETVAHSICGRPTTYQPQLWFNSAKFLDIEYQVYGSVGNNVREGESHLYWEHEDGRKSIRLVYETETGKILGFNLMGVRYRQDVCQAWIRAEASIEEVLQNLGATNFDPEFFKPYEPEVVAQYNQQSGKNLKLQRKKGLKHAFAVLTQLTLIPKKTPI